MIDLSGHSRRNDLSYLEGLISYLNINSIIVLYFE